MSYLLIDILPPLQVLKLLGRPSEFSQWLYKRHGLAVSKEIFAGYLFSIQCCLNQFLDGISNDYDLEIENDLVLSRANQEWQPLHQLDNSCEKIVLLKRINPVIKEIVRAKNIDQLEKSLEIFQSAVGILFDQINEQFVVVKSGSSITKEVATKLSIIDFAHTYLVQINDNGPVANAFHPSNVKWETDERKDLCFKGYKYALQFLWFKILDKEAFEQSSLVRLHLADSWRNYKYKNESAGDMVGKEFELEEQNSLDSYFWRIKEEITNDLDAKYGLLVHQVYDELEFQQNNYQKMFFFSEWLNNEGLDEPFDDLSWREKLRNKLYWYPISVVDSMKSPLHFGIPSFNTMLAGTIVLHRKDISRLKKTIVVKFIHPHTDNVEKRDYSYGILIDTLSAAGHYHNGWVIYANACGDYSGFSGSEHKSTESLLEQYKREGKLEVRELEIPLIEFQKFADPYMKQSEELGLRQKYDAARDNLQHSRGYCLELFTYSLHLKLYNNVYDEISIAADKNDPSGDKDIFLVKGQKVKLIECKLNPNNWDLIELIGKMDKKLANYQQEDKSFEFWFWKMPSTQNAALLKERNIEWVTVSEPEKYPILKGVDLGHLEKMLGPSIPQIKD